MRRVFTGVRVLVGVNGWAVPSGSITYAGTPGTPISLYDRDVSSSSFTGDGVTQPIATFLADAVESRREDFRHLRSWPELVDATRDAIWSLRRWIFLQSITPPPAPRRVKSRGALVERRCQWRTRALRRR